MAVEESTEAVLYLYGWPSPLCLLPLTIIGDTKAELGSRPTLKNSREGGGKHLVKTGLRVLRCMHDAPFLIYFLN